MIFAPNRFHPIKFLFYLLVVLAVWGLVGLAMYLATLLGANSAESFPNDAAIGAASFFAFASFLLVAIVPIWFFIDRVSRWDGLSHLDWIYGLGHMSCCWCLPIGAVACVALSLVSARVAILDTLAKEPVMEIRPSVSCGVSGNYASLKSTEKERATLPYFVSASSEFWAAEFRLVEPPRLDVAPKNEDDIRFQSFGLRVAVFEILPLIHSNSHPATTNHTESNATLNTTLNATLAPDNNNNHASCLYPARLAVLLSNDCLESNGCINSTIRTLQRIGAPVAVSSTTTKSKSSNTTNSNTKHLLRTCRASRLFSPIPTQVEACAKYEQSTLWTREQIPIVLLLPDSVDGTIEDPSVAAQRFQKYKIDGVTFTFVTCIAFVAITTFLIGWAQSPYDEKGPWVCVGLMVPLSLLLLVISTFGVSVACLLTSTKKSSEPDNSIVNSDSWCMMSHVGAVVLTSIFSLLVAGPLLIYAGAALRVAYRYCTQPPVPVMYHSTLGNTHSTIRNSNNNNSTPENLRAFRPGFVNNMQPFMSPRYQEQDYELGPDEDIDLPTSSRSDDYQYDSHGRRIYHPHQWYARELFGDDAAPAPPRRAPAPPPTAASPRVFIFDDDDLPLPPRQQQQQQHKPARQQQQQRAPNPPPPPPTAPPPGYTATPKQQQQQEEEQQPREEQRYRASTPRNFYFGRQQQQQQQQERYSPQGTPSNGNDASPAPAFSNEDPAADVAAVAASSPRSTSEVSARPLRPEYIDLNNDDDETTYNLQSDNISESAATAAVVVPEQEVAIGVLHHSHAEII